VYDRAPFVANSTFACTCRENRAIIDRAYSSEHSCAPVGGVYDLTPPRLTRDCGITERVAVYCLSAESQCSAIFPFSMRKTSNQVVLSCLVLFFGCGYLRV